VLNIVLASTLHTARVQQRVAIPYSPTFLDQVQAGNIRLISSKGTSIQGTFRNAVKYPNSSSKPTTLFSTELPAFTTTTR